MFTLHQLPKLSTTSLGCQRQHNGPTDVYHSLQKECRSQRHASSWSDHVIGRKLRRRQRVVVSTPPLWTWGAFFLFLIVRHFFHFQLEDAAKDFRLLRCCPQQHSHHDRWWVVVGCSFFLHTRVPRRDSWFFIATLASQCICTATSPPCHREAVARFCLCCCFEIKLMRFLRDKGAAYLNSAHCIFRLRGIVWRFNSLATNISLGIWSIEK